MRKQGFYKLPRSIQDRFIESSQAIAAPAPLAASPARETRSLKWGAASGVCVAAWGGFVLLGFGDLTSPFALTTMVQKAMHVGFAATAVVCGLRAYSFAWASRRIPYGSGDYLFPSGVVAAREGDLAIYDAATLESAQAVGASVVLKYAGGGKFSFPAGTAEAAEAVAVAVRENSSVWKDLPETELLKRARLNPLVESGVPNPLAPTQPHYRPVFLGIFSFLALSALLAVCLGVAVATYRDSLSKKALYHSALSANSVKAYRAYLSRGGDRPEVSGLLLPRAELVEAMAVGSVDALQAFQDKNPASQIGIEIQNALRAGLLKELAKAQQEKSLRALEALPKRFKSHELIAAELVIARRALYADAMASFQAEASEVDVALVPFIEQLLTYAEQHGPRVELRFFQNFEQDPKMLDLIVSKSEKYYLGRKSLPMQYFLGDVARRREKEILEKVRARLQKSFSPEILEFVLGAPTESENAPIPEIVVPTLSFVHSERLSGGFVGGLPKAMYLGAAVLMEARGAIPGNEGAKLLFQWNAWRSPEFAILADRTKDVPDIYEDMMGGIFRSFSDLYLARWFKTP